MQVLMHIKTINTIWIYRAFTWVHTVTFPRLAIIYMLFWGQIQNPIT